MTQMLVETIGENLVKVTRASDLSGKMGSMLIECCSEQLKEFAKGYPGRSIQAIFPNISSDEREFLKTGILPDEWEDLFKGAEANGWGDKNEP